MKLAVVTAKQCTSVNQKSSFKQHSNNLKRSVRNCDCEKNEIVKYCWEPNHNFSWILITLTKFATCSLNYGFLILRQFLVTYVISVDSNLSKLYKVITFAFARLYCLIKLISCTAQLPLSHISSSASSVVYIEGTYTTHPIF